MIMLKLIGAKRFEINMVINIEGTVEDIKNGS